MTEGMEWHPNMVTAEDLVQSFNKDVLEVLARSSEPRVTNYFYPLNGTRRAYRGWYHVSGTTQSRWCPRQSRYDGPRPGGLHKGLDLWSYEATKIVAVTRGTVEYNPRNDPDGWGEHIYLYFRQGGQTYIALYAHLDPASAFPHPKEVAAGNEIGIPGCSGNAGNNGNCHRAYRCNGRIAVEDHLHFELMKADGTRIDPIPFFGFANIEHAADNNCTVCGSNQQLG